MQPEWDKGWIWGIIIVALTAGGVVYDSGDPASYWPALVIPLAGWVLFVAYVETQKAK